MWRGALALGLLVSAGLAGCGDELTATRAASEPPLLEFQRGPHAREFMPYMGIACPDPNSVRCDRVGLAVRLQKPARRLTARIAGVPVEMKSPGEFVAGRGTGWEGYLHPARLADGPLRVSATSNGRWMGDPAVHGVVHLTAELRDGSTAERTLMIWLAPGWG